MPLADTLNRKPGDILKSDDWNIIIKEIDRLETAKINRDGADTLKGPLTIAEALNANSNVTIKGSLSIVVPQPQEPSGQILVLGPTNASNLRLGYHQDYSWIQSHGSKPLLINRLGNNIGIGSTINPVARLDIASASRTGTHPTAVKGLYITGDFNADNDGVEFRHSSGTQGIGFGFNTIYAAGSNANQDLGLKPKGTGEVTVSGNLSVSGIVKIGSLQLGGFTSEDKDEWPNVFWSRDLNQNWDEGLIKHSFSRGFFKKAGFGIHFHEKRQFGFWSTGWIPLFAVDGGTGNTYIKGNIGTSGQAPNGGGHYPSSWVGGVHTWDVIAEATVGYSNLQKWSSIKEKNNIRPLGKVLDKLDKLNPVFFDRMKQYRNGKANNLGFIAEEVREVFPEIIEEYNPDNPEFFAAAMQMDAIATLSIAGIQELSRKLKILKQGISVDRWGNVAIGQKKPLQDHKLYISGDLRIDCKTSAEASSGQAILPANPVGFMIINVGGKDYKIPYYDL